MHSICGAQDGTLWVGTRLYGLLHYDGSTWTQDGTQDGLSGHTVTHISQADDGSLWAATRKGVCRFDGRRWKAYPPPLDQDMGWGGSIKQSSDGSLWINQPRQYTIRYIPDTRPPETEITMFLDEVSQPGNTTLTWQGADPWRTTPKEKLEYAWRLDGGERSLFSKASNKTFLALSGGNIRLR